MSEVKLGSFYKVEIIESERGWGQRTDEIKYFDTEPDALKFVEEFNRSNNLEVAPDWYMVARYLGKVK